MRVKLLSSSAGRSSQFQSLTSFTIDDRLAIDAGSIGFALAPNEIGSVHHFIITHAHTDHTASLPIYVAEAFPVLETPVIVYGTAEVVSALREFVFNDRVWPNFEEIRLNNGSGPALEFRELQPRETATSPGSTLLRYRSITLFLLLGCWSTAKRRPRCSLQILTRPMKFGRPPQPPKT